MQKSMQKNDLTLAICLYNAEKYIEETLTCLINQTFQGFDLLIVDDCSTDGGIEVVRSFFKTHFRQYEVVHIPVNKGLCVGRRFVEEYVQTKYLLFIDADDCPYPTMVEKLYNKITSDSDLMAVGCYLEYIDDERNRIKGGIFLGESTKEEFYEKAKNKKLIFLPSTSIYDRLVALQVGGHNIDGFPDGKPRYQDFCEDLDLWTRMSDLFIERKAIIVVPEILYQYRKTGDTVSKNSLGMVLRMKHIKSNLLKRRAGEKEQTFIDFYNSLSVDDINSLKKNALAADSLRNGVFFLRKGKILQGVKNISISVWNKPNYIMQKIKKNSGLFR